MPKDLSQFSAQLLSWYDRHARIMPWRSPPGGARPDPYHVWLSEIMLQQTTVVTVGPYFEGFLRRWPTLHALAAAPLDDVLHAWAGLGYYARARNLHKCAGVVSRELGGKFPDHEEGLMKLPGIGPYTAAAIAAIAFDRQACVVDGNVERVMARLYAIQTPLPDAKPELKRRAAALTPAVRPGDYAQAVMDLGATICTPRSPACGLCPWQAPCQARALGIEAGLPARRPKLKRPTRRGHIFWLETNDAITGERMVLIRRRPESGLLGGMMEFPGSDWTVSKSWDDVDAPMPPALADWHRLPGVVEHVFTHFSLEMSVHRARLLNPPPVEGLWQPVNRLREVALPTVMTKVITHVERHAP